MPNIVTVYDETDTPVGTYETISDAISNAGTLNGYKVVVGDGTYIENVVINKSITLVSEHGRGSTIIDGVQAGGQLGAIQITPSTDGVTIGAAGQGFTINGINGNGAIEKAAIYIQGNHDNLTIVGNELVARGDSGLTSEFGAAVTNVLIDGNTFSGTTFEGANPSGSDQFAVGNNVPRQLVVMGNGGSGPYVSNNITFTHNTVSGTAGGYNLSSQEQGNTLVTIDAANSEISNNDFDGFTDGGGFAVRARGPNTDFIDNTIDQSVNGSDSQGFLIDNKGTPGIYTGNEIIGDDDADNDPGETDDDAMSGTPGGDSFLGQAGDDAFLGQAGNDTFDGGAGNDGFDGGDGIDRAVFSGNLADYTVTLGSITVTDDNAGDGDDGTDTLNNVETLQFADATVQVVGAGGFATIQAAIDAASAGDVILIADGTYEETLNVNKAVTLKAAGSGAILQGTITGEPPIPPDTHLDVWLETAEPTSYSSSPGANGITVASSNVTIDGLTISGFINGIALGTSDGVTIVNNTLTDNIVGIRKGTADAVTNVTISDNTIEHGYHGITTYAASDGSGAFDGVTMDDNSFSALSEKGMYFEQLSNASLTGNTFDHVGNFGRVTPVFGGTTGNFGNAIDINLKYETYSNVTFTDTEITSSGYSNQNGDADYGTHGGAIGIKIRDDAPSYNSPAAEFTGQIVFQGGFIDGTSTGVRIGEPGKDNLGPNVLFDGMLISNTALTDVDNATDPADGGVATVDFEATQADLDASASQAPVDITGNNLDNEIAGGSADDTIDGLNGSDSLSGGDGDDHINAGGGADTVRGGDGDDDINGGNSADLLLGENGDDSIAGGSGADTLDGGAGHDTMAGGNGDDTYVVNRAADELSENADSGIDTVLSTVTRTLEANVENLTLLDADENLEDFEDFALGPITNGENGWYVAGGPGRDQEIVLDPDDPLNQMFRMSSDPSSADFAGPYTPALADTSGEPQTTADYDSMQMTFTLKAFVPGDNSRLEVDFGIDPATDRNNFMVIENTASGIRIATNEPLLDGNWAVNSFAAFTGNRTIVDGLDNTVAHQIQLVLTYLDGVDNDVIDIYVDGALVGQTTTFENYRVAVEGKDHATAAELNQTSRLFFRPSAGGAPTDGPGGQNQGFLFDDISYSVFNSAGIDGTGNDLDNVITGNNLANVLSGLGGDDTLIGGLGNDTLYGNNGNDVLDGGEGADSALGYVGDDLYYVDNAGDVVLEFANDGNDTVIASIDYTLANNIEDLTLAGAAISGTGNGSSNVITGNDGDNLLSGLANFDTIYGGDGNDTLDGGSARDSLIGGAGDDSLDGGTGSDTMYGGAGNDVYIIDNGADKSLEDAGGGIDTEFSSVLRGLGANIENLTLTGGAAIDGTGNGLNNVITGNDAANLLKSVGGNDTISGAGGADTLLGGTDMDLIYGGDGDDSLNGENNRDTMYGGDGNDTYIIDNGADQTQEDANHGIDTEYSSVVRGLGANIENLTLTGAAAIDGTGNGLDNVLTGNDAANLLKGNGGNDTLLGEGGADTLFGGPGTDFLTGGAGADYFRFEGNNTTNTITDFVRGVDDIQILGYGASLDSFAELSITEVGGDSRINLSAAVPGAGTIFVLGVTDLDASDFLFS
jgi:Hemolysin-type calcium-binding repeat (2 copies).